MTLSLTSSSLTASQLALHAGRIIPAFSRSSASQYARRCEASCLQSRSIRKAGRERLTLTDVVNTIAGSNVRAPGGIAYGPNRETNIDIHGDIDSPASILGLPIATSGAVAAGPTLPGAIDPWTSAAGVVSVRDVATVSDSYLPKRQYGSVNGLTGAFLQIQKASDASEVDASDNVLAALPKIKAQFPQINFGIVNVQSKYSAQQLDGVIARSSEGVFLTGVVMLFFLGSWRNAIVVLIAIPASLGVALFVMKMMGLTLDTISLLGMTLVVGILVDDSTVVLENIERHHAELHQPPMEAAISGRSEIGVAAIVITLVDVVVFLPIAFIQSQIGRQLAEFGIVVVIATLTSLFISFTVTPALAGNWALRSSGGRGDDRRVHARIRQRAGVVRAPRLPWRSGTARSCWCVCGLRLSLRSLVRSASSAGVVPKQDRGGIFIQVQFPIGTPLTQTTAALLKLERAVREIPTWTPTLRRRGYAAPFGGFVTRGNAGQIHIWLRSDRARSTDAWVSEYRTLARKVVPGAKTTVVPRPHRRRQRATARRVGDRRGGRRSASTPRRSRRRCAIRPVRST